ncbi:hypothetical protein DDZ13_15185 [Coraliomargarita sinensis]|uniref:Uncharacterized protein n=1 Tax=Coraliomargarita sinensis TaxID=2174842 RepID=A0A317ZGB6_9BACT|nr:hypothetical protein [Coraliomargarita sinensis]PXA02819.1 hypothetical protein DDZ13_15185 [Coraliomargarita sinensis]
MENEPTVRAIEYSLLNIYGHARTVEAIVLLSILALLFIAGCVAYSKGKKMKGFLWGLGSMSVLLFLHGVWRFGNENFKFHEMFSDMSQQTYHIMQLEIYAPLMVSTSLSAIGVFFTMILGILDSKNERT